jgi:hypothetical protein
MGEDGIGGHGLLVIIELEELHDQGQGRARFVTHPGVSGTRLIRGPGE